MADWQAGTGQFPRPAATNTITEFLRRLHDHSPISVQLLCFFVLLVSGGLLLLISGVTIAAGVVSLIFFAPFLLVSSPVWVPVGTVLFISTAGFLFVCGFTVAFLAASFWMYRYFKGLHPPGSDRVDYARSRIADTASHVKDYATEYGGYLHSKVRDAAPGA